MALVEAGLTRDDAYRWSRGGPAGLGEGVHLSDLLAEAASPSSTSPRSSTTAVLRHAHALFGGSTGSRGSVGPLLLASVWWAKPPNSGLDLHCSGQGPGACMTVGEDRLLMVASDRISAYDVVLPTPFPTRGRCSQGSPPSGSRDTAGCARTTFVSADVPDQVRAAASRPQLEISRSSVSCADTSRLRVEGIPGAGAVCGIDLPAGLRESDRLPEPIFTPATKAELGDHDENVDFDRAAEIVGDRALMEELRRLSLAIYTTAPSTPSATGSCWRTPSSSSAAARTGDRARRRGAHAGLLPVLADRPVRARAAPSRLRQAVRARLAGPVRLGPPPSGPELPADVVTNTRQSTSRPTSASPASRSPPG